MRITELVILYALNALQRSERTSEGIEWRGVPAGAIAEYICSGDVYRGPDIRTFWRPDGATVGALMKRLRNIGPHASRRRALVELDPRSPSGQKWYRMTDAGVKVLSA